MKQANLKLRPGSWKTSLLRRVQYLSNSNQNCRRFITLSRLIHHRYTSFHTSFSSLEQTCFTAIIGLFVSMLVGHLRFDSSLYCHLYVLSWAGNLEYIGCDGEHVSRKTAGDTCEASIGMIGKIGELPSGNSLVRGQRQLPGPTTTRHWNDNNVVCGMYMMRSPMIVFTQAV